jgi:hypothetical protein
LASSQSLFGSVTKLFLPFQIVQGTSAAVGGLVSGVRSLVTSGSNLDSNATFIADIVVSTTAEIAGGSAAAVVVVLSGGVVLWYRYWYKETPCKT